jgi:hypothetical protein
VSRWAGLALLCLLVTFDAEARPGGGSSFSSSSHSSSSRSSSSSSHSWSRSSSSRSSSGSSSGSCAENVVGTLIMFVLFGGVAGVRHLFEKYAKQKGWSTGRQAAPFQQPGGVSGEIRKQLETIRLTDPDFSVVLLEDFVYALYAEAQTARGEGATARLAPYLRPAARAVLDMLGAHPVSGIVVGAMSYKSFSAGDRLSFKVELETNYTEQHESDRIGVYARERWTLSRRPGARSRAPETVRVIGCPHCGAPLDRLLGGTCQYCNQVVDDGTYDWVVDLIEIRKRQNRPPTLTGTAEEVGTDLPTLFDPFLPRAIGQLRDRDRAFDGAAFTARVGHIFQVMQTAWSSLAWEQARPFLTDNLFETQSYWMAAYREQGLRNVTTDNRITRIEIARITKDRWFSAITVRLFATGHDYTIREADGQIVGGSQTEERTYSEYWTLIRGAERTGAARADSACPNCGAPLELGMAALCKHCQAKVNSGAFDWVLSRIEQDEVYAG